MKHLLILIGFILISQRVMAEDKKDSLRVYQIPAITVTTTRAEERRSPTAFSEIGKQKIDELYTTEDIPLLLNSLPSVTVYSQSGNGVGYSNLNMRGFDQRRLSVMINGIPQNDPEDHNVYWIDFPDLAASLDNIQVQRGAGLINYGAAAIGGSINLTTSNFTETRGIKIYNGIGYQNKSDNLAQSMSKHSVEVSSGIVDEKYAFYGRLSRINSLGYRRHSWSYLNSYFLSAVRFDKNLTTQINLFGGPLRDALVYNGLPKSYIDDKSKRRMNLAYWVYDTTGQNVQQDWSTPRRDGEIEDFSQPHYEILNDWKISDKLTLKSSAFFYSGKGYYDYDGSWASAEMLGLNANNGYPDAEEPTNTLIRAMVENRHGGWIPRLIWEHNSGSLMVGAEMRWHRSQHFGTIEYAGNLPDNFDQKFRIYNNDGIRDIYSIFARESYQATDDITINLEAQLVRQRYGLENIKYGNDYVSFQSIDNETVTADEPLFDIIYWFINPRMGVNWNIDEKMNVYGSLAYTSREPRMRNLYAADDVYFGSTPLFNSDTTADGTRLYDFSDPIVKPERMLNLELGWHYIDENYNLNANAYWMEYSDELVKSGQLDIWGNPIDGNAERTRHYGLELLASAKLFELYGGDIKLSANATFSKNEIIKYDFIANTGETISLEGNEIAGFPSMMANFRLSYDNGSFYGMIHGKYHGSYRTDNFADMIQTSTAVKAHLLYDPWDPQYYFDNTLDAFFVLNASVQYTFRDIFGLQSVKLQAFINNITDKLYAAGAEGKEFFPAPRRNFYLAIEFGL